MLSASKPLYHITSDMRICSKEKFILYPNVLNAGLDLFHAFRRAITFAMDIAGMLQTVPHQFFGGLSPNHEIAIRLEILAGQLLILPRMSCHGFHLPLLQR